MEPAPWAEPDEAVFESYGLGRRLPILRQLHTRILGWPRHYSDSAEDGEIFLEKARYLSDTGRVEDEVVVDGPGVLLTKAAGISHVEFLRLTASIEEDSHGEADDPLEGREEPASS